MQTHGSTQFAGSTLAIFAHELREPLASILLAAQAAQDTGNDHLANREMWGIVERQSRFLACIIDQVMELGRGPHDQAALSKEWFDLGAMVTGAVEAVKSLLIKRGHRLTLALPVEPVFVLADALRLRQVVINLLANAAKYTEYGGQIDVALKVVNGLVMIEVRDNGVGISPDLLPRVFDLFRQGGKPRGGKSSGLGIGLALVKSLVELHGGSVTARSGGTGAGSTFVVLLPQAERDVRKWQTVAPGTYEQSAAEPAWASSPMVDA